MKHPGRLILALALFVALPLSAETLMQCMSNCLPGVNPCNSCCIAQFDAAKGPCLNACQVAQKPCFDAAWNACEGSLNQRFCYDQKQVPCLAAIFSCERNCDETVQIAGGCPDEVPPKPCPYNCQIWNSVSRTCIGPKMNVCAGMQASAKVQNNTMADRMKARAKKDAEAAAAATEKMKAEAAKKQKGKKKSK